MTYAAWDVVTVPFPYTDSQTTKKRPALVLSSPTLESDHGLVWLAMITSANNAPWIGDVVITDLLIAGLPNASVVRPAKIATIGANFITKRLGTLCDTDRQSVVQTVWRYRASQ